MCRLKHRSNATVQYSERVLHQWGMQSLSKWALHTHSACLCSSRQGNRSSINAGLPLCALLFPLGKTLQQQTQVAVHVAGTRSLYILSSFCTCAGFLMFHSHSFHWIMHERQEWYFFFNPLYLYDSFIHYSCVDSCVKVISCTWVWLNSSKSELSSANRK